ncbi:MAG TPA: tRNA (adenosine(37)-N6)-threonylcarbamoyltransferase complex dimerization subunit type 1 TsaB, partial [Gammaproteobacteria bacterium]|nr:tRNA (adenosine(37)-N6)-threonylcarbamoyltransferase complex dimerization subunit type 1 TsaB [Gammaproteobacteria bacterium]
MKITLCIETSGPHCSLALAAGEQIFHRAEPLQRRHNERVLPLIQALYQEAGVSLEATELVGFGAGPGSFTGVRIAASIAQGLALATNSRVVPMPGSEILLASARRQYSGPQKMGWLGSIPSRGGGPPP